MRFYTGIAERVDVGAQAGKGAKDGHLQYALRDPLTSEYRIVSLLGEGTFGRVFECWDFVTGGTCAVKVIRKSIGRVHGRDRSLEDARGRRRVG